MNCFFQIRFPISRSYSRSRIQHTSIPRHQSSSQPQRIFHLFHGIQRRQERRAQSRRFPFLHLRQPLPQQVRRPFNYQKRMFSSRGNVDLYLTGGRLSRVDSYVRDIHTPYEYEVPSTYERYRSSSRSGLGYSSINGYTVSLSFFSLFDPSSPNEESKPGWDDIA